MSTVRLFGWQPGIQFITLIKLVRDQGYTGNLREAKDRVEGLIGGDVLELDVAGEDEAAWFVEVARGLGAFADIPRHPPRTWHWDEPVHWQLDGFDPVDASLAWSAPLVGMLDYIAAEILDMVPNDPPGACDVSPGQLRRLMPFLPSGVVPVEGLDYLMGEEAGALVVPWAGFDPVVEKGSR